MGSRPAYIVSSRLAIQRACENGGRIETQREKNKERKEGRERGREGRKKGKAEFCSVFFFFF